MLSILKNIVNINVCIVRKAFPENDWTFLPVPNCDIKKKTDFKLWGFILWELKENILKILYK